MVFKNFKTVGNSREENVYAKEKVSYWNESNEIFGGNIRTLKNSNDEIGERKTFMRLS